MSDLAVLDLTEVHQRTIYPDDNPVQWALLVAHRRSKLLFRDRCRRQGALESAPIQFLVPPIAAIGPPLSCFDFTTSAG